MGWFAVQLSEQECFQVPLESKETLAGTKFLYQFVTSLALHIYPHVWDLLLALA
jgi:hypothetical protein